MSIRYEIKDFDDLDISDDGTEMEVLFNHTHNGNNYVDIPIEMVLDLLRQQLARLAKMNITKSPAGRTDTQ